MNNSEFLLEISESEKQAELADKWVYEKVKLSGIESEVVSGRRD
jgi:hypothetical protein